MRHRFIPASAGVLLAFAFPLLAQAPRPAPAATQAPPSPSPSPSPTPSPQPRPHGTRVAVDIAALEVDDGDTVVIRRSREDSETVRILGIDAPETRHLEHDLPYAQEFGEQALAFARGAFAAASQVELLRSATLDPFGRTLGYLFLNGRNYSALVVRARLAEESVTRYGDNGLPREAAEVLAEAKAAGPLPFQSPGDFRGRMRALSNWMKDRGVYPEK